MSDDHSIETIVPALYAYISGRAGAPRDWARFRSLLRPDARFLLSVTDSVGREHAQEFGVEGYIADVAPFLTASSCGTTTRAGVSPKSWEKGTLLFSASSEAT